MTGGGGDPAKNVPSPILVKFLTFVYFCVFLGVAFSALTLLVGRQDGHPACKKTEQWGTGVIICLEFGADLHMSQLLLQTDNHTSTPPLKFFTGRMPFLPPNQQHKSTESTIYWIGRDI